MRDTNESLFFNYSEAISGGIRICLTENSPVFKQRCRYQSQNTILNTSNDSTKFYCSQFSLNKEIGEITLTDFLGKVSIRKFRNLKNWKKNSLKFH